MRSTAPPESTGCVQYATTFFAPCSFSADAALHSVFAVSTMSSMITHVRPSTSPMMFITSLSFARGRVGTVPALRDTLGTGWKFPIQVNARGGLSWYGDGRGCNTLTGWFIVENVTYSGATITAIDLRFEQHCESASPALHGQVHWTQ